MSQFVNEPSEGGPQILECHSPIMNLLDKYPIIGRLEQDMFERAARDAGAPRRNPHFRVSTSARFTSRFKIACSSRACARTHGRQEFPLSLPAKFSVD